MVDERAGESLNYANVARLTSGKVSEAELEAMRSGTLNNPTVGNLALLQRILDHTSIKTTADVYVHLGETSKKRAMERFGQNLKGPRDPRKAPKSAG